MNTGTAKKIKRELMNNLTLENPYIEYKELKKINRRKKLQNNIPRKKLKTKRHDNETFDEFQKRRKKANKNKRERRNENI